MTAFRGRHSACVSLLVPLLALLGGGATRSQQADPDRIGNADAGRTIAEQWCSGCHAVGGRGTDAAPPLAVIAKDPTRTEDWLRAWLTDPHPPMPRLDLSRRDIADVIAYLDTLR